MRVVSAGSDELAALCDLVSPMVMRATVTLGLAEALAERARPVRALADELGLDAAALTRLVGFLAARGIVATDEDDGDDENCGDEARKGGWVVRLTERGAPLASADPDSPWPVWLDWAGAGGYLDRLFIDDLMPVLRTGRPRHHVWRELAGDRCLGASFDEMMSARAAEWVPPVVALDLWAGVRRAVDVGGGRGHLLRALVRAWPHLEGVLVERAGPAAWATREVRADPDLARRLEIVVGDLGAELPPGGDAYLFAHVVHDWPDEPAAEILCRAGRAVGRGGRVLVIERLLDDPAGRREASRQDLRMLVFFGGHERTHEQFAKLGTTAGLRLTETQPAGAGRHVLTFRPQTRT
jgi:SAM-dependent methyltransferase